MSTVNLSMRLVAQIIKRMHRFTDNDAAQIVDALADAAVRAADAEERKPKTIAISTPDGKGDEKFCQVFGLGRRINHHPELWPTPNPNDCANAFGMLWAGIDLASPSGKPDTESLRKVAKALNTFEPAWNCLEHDELLKYVLAFIDNTKYATQERSNNLVERFNLLEKIRSQVGAEKWDEIIGKIIHLQNRTLTSYPDLRTTLKALPEESLDEAAKRQMKNADSNATAAETLDFIAKDLGILPGMDIVEFVKNLRQASIDLSSNQRNLHRILRDNAHDHRSLEVLASVRMDTLKRVRSALCPAPDSRELEVIATARMQGITGLHQTIGDRDAEIIRLNSKFNDAERCYRTAQDSADYRGQCLDQIADALNLEQGRRTPQYVVEAIGVLTKGQVSEAQKAAEKAEAAADRMELEDLRSKLNRANLALSDIRDVVYAVSRSSNSDWAMVIEILERVKASELAPVNNAETTLARIRSIMHDGTYGIEVQRQRVMELLK